jgi:hypothetical protein
VVAIAYQEGHRQCPTLKAGKIMSKERNSKKEAKKKAAMTPKEKKAAKKAKKNERGRVGE